MVGGPAQPRSPGVSLPEPTVIKVRDHGPYRVTGRVRLVDAEGTEWRVPPGESLALCRCGGSAIKPFCDRSHRDGGFRSCDRA